MTRLNQLWPPCSESYVIKADCGHHVVRVMYYKQSSPRWAAYHLTRAPVGAIYEWVYMWLWPRVHIP
jgi:hypothetical protein